MFINLHLGLGQRAQERERGTSHTLQTNGPSPSTIPRLGLPSLSPVVRPSAGTTGFIGRPCCPRPSCVQQSGGRSRRERNPRLWVSRPGCKRASSARYWKTSIITHPHTHTHTSTVPLPLQSRDAHTIKQGMYTAHKGWEEEESSRGRLVGKQTRSVFINSLPRIIYHFLEFFKTRIRINVCCLRTSFPLPMGRRCRPFLFYARASLGPRFLFVPLLNNIAERNHRRRGALEKHF